VFHGLTGIHHNSNTEDSFTSLLNSWIECTHLNRFGLEALYLSFISTSFVKDIQYYSSRGEVKFERSFVNLYGTSIPSVLFQLYVLQHWEPKLDKISMTTKRTILTTCSRVSGSNFDSYADMGVNQILNIWYENPLKYSNSITTYFSSLGFF